jgi:hypothetical protein
VVDPAYLPIGSMQVPAKADMLGSTENTTFIMIKHRIGTTSFSGVVHNRTMSI